MSTNKPRFSITVSNETYEAINTYQHEHRLSTQTKAISELLEKGINSLLNPSSPITSPGTSFTSHEIELIMAYRSADPRTRSIVDLALEDFIVKSNVG